MPFGLLECQKGNQLKTTRWDFHFRSLLGASQHANFYAFATRQQQMGLTTSPAAQFHNLKEKQARSCQLRMGGIPGLGSAPVPANTPALGNLFDPFIFGDEGQSAELITS